MAEISLENYVHGRVEDKRKRLIARNWLMHCRRELKLVVNKSL